MSLNALEMWCPGIRLPGIVIVAASSSEGRVERNHGTHQDRLVKKLRRKKVSSDEAANQYLGTQCLGEHNQRFAQAASAEQDYHGNAPKVRELRQIFRLETEPSIGRDWLIQHHDRSLQPKPGQRRYGLTQSKALVCEREDGTLK